MAKRPPELKKSSDPRVGTGTNEPFKKNMLKNVKCLDTRHPAKLRDGFTRKFYMVPADPVSKLPEEVNTWKVKKPAKDEYRGRKA